MNLVSTSLGGSPLVPVLILTGDLGAGKTTLINRLLSGARWRVTVVENEAGEIGIDADLVVGAAEILDLPEGCACCTVRGALSSALEDLAGRADGIDVLIVELSGLADPAPVLQAFHEPVIRSAFRVAALVGVVSAAGPSGGTLWRRQLRFADAAVVTKAPDGEGVFEALGDVVRRAARPSTVLLAAADVTLSGLLDIRGSVAARPAPHTGHEHGAEPAPVTVAIEQDGDVDRERFDAWLAGEIVAAGPNLARVKGIVAVTGSARRYVLHVAYGRADARFERPWLGRRRSRLVFIGHDIDRDRLRAGLHGCAARGGARATTGVAPSLPGHETRRETGA